MREANTQTVERKTRQSMTVAELISVLQQCPDEDAPVVFQSDYGDHCHTQQLSTFKTVVPHDSTEEYIYEAAYSSSGLAVKELDYEDAVDEDEEDIVIYTAHKLVILK